MSFESNSNLVDPVLDIYSSQQECKTILKLAKVKDEKILNTGNKFGAWIFNLLKAEIPVLKFRSS